MPSPQNPLAEAVAAGQVTPDMLLLEIIDALSLAYPTTVSLARLTFQPTADGLYPGLSEIDGAPASDAVNVPNLGHGEALLDGVNEMLRDLTDVTDAQADLRVTAGYLEIDYEAEDGAIDVVLVDTADGDAVAKLKRRFDKSERTWLLNTPELFGALGSTENEEVAQGADIADRLEGAADFALDLTKGQLRFTRGDDGATEFDVQLIGSWSNQSMNFMWGWANEAAPKRVTARIDQFRRAHGTAGLRALYKPEVCVPELMAMRLSRHAAVRMAAQGVCRLPFRSEKGQGFMYLAVMDQNIFAR